MTLSQQQLSDITKALSHIEGRVTEPNGYHVIIKDANQNDIYIQGQYTGYDFHLAIQFIKAMLKALNTEPLPPSDELVDYGQIPIGETLPVDFAFAPATNYNAFVIARRAAEFASVMRRRKSKDYFRYQKNENGNKVGAPFVWANLDAGKDYLILATMLEMLAMTLGATVISPDRDIQQPYTYFEEALKLDTVPAPIPPLEDVDALKKEVAELRADKARLEEQLASVTAERDALKSANEAVKNLDNENSANQAAAKVNNAVVALRDAIEDLRKIAPHVPNFT